MSLITTSVDAIGLPVACPVAILADKYDALLVEQEASDNEHLALSPDARRIEDLGGARKREYVRRDRHMDVLDDIGCVTIATSRRGVAWQAERIGDLVDRLEGCEHDEEQAAHCYDLIGRFAHSIERYFTAQPALAGEVCGQHA